LKIGLFYCDDISPGNAHPAPASACFSSNNFTPCRELLNRAQPEWRREQEVFWVTPRS